MISDAFRSEYAERPEAEYDLDRQCLWVHLTEQQATDVASGYVPNAVKSVIRELLEFREEDERRPARPIQAAHGMRRRAKRVVPRDAP